MQVFVWWTSDSSTATVPSLPMDGQSPRTAAPNCHPGVATRGLRTSNRRRPAPTEMNARTAAATCTTNRCSAAALATSSTPVTAAATPAPTAAGTRLRVAPPTPRESPAPNAVATPLATRSASTTASAVTATPTSSQTSMKPTLDRIRLRSNYPGLFFCWAVPAGYATAPVSSRIHP